MHRVLALAAVEGPVPLREAPAALRVLEEEDRHALIRLLPRDAAEPDPERELHRRGADPPAVVLPGPGLKGSIGEGPNHSNFSDRSSDRILGIQRKPRKAPSRKKPVRILSKFRNFR